MIDDDGYLYLAWQYNNETPKKKIYPYLVKKRGDTEKTFDVSLSGKSTDYKGISPSSFIEKLVSGSFQNVATVRMKPMRTPGSQGNGWLIRNIKVETALSDSLSKNSSGFQTLESVQKEQDALVKALHGATQDEINEQGSSYPKVPDRVQVLTTVFRRNPAVVINVLRRANGLCEGCGNAAPFSRRSDGTPYLEVHHTITLANGGEDTVENAVALCPNCHRCKHHG